MEFPYRSSLMYMHVLVPKLIKHMHMANAPNITLNIYSTYY